MVESVLGSKVRYNNGVLRWGYLCGIIDVGVRK